MSRTSHIDVAVLRRRYVDDAAPVAVIADELGVTVSTVHRALRREGVEPRGVTGRAEWGDVLTPEMLEGCLSEGMTVREIAADAGCDHVTVREWMARHGLSDALTAREREAYRSWYEREGLSVAAVAERAGIGRRTARRYLLEAGVALRPRGRPPGT